MEPREQRTVLILADISGYTRFMVENQVSALHGQVLITLLIETLLAEVDIPLVLHGIEGDAVFLSANHPGTDAGWRDVLAQVGRKLPRFFEAFLAGLVRAAEVTPCECPTCRNVDQLKLKIIVHSGVAVFHSIAGLAQVSGTDVIIAHRLLKNSVPGGEYLLMTDAAYRDVGVDMGLDFQPGEEDCEGIGKVKTWVHLLAAEKERARDEFYARPASEVAADPRRYFLWLVPGMWRGLVQQLRHPTIAVSWPRRIAFAIRQLVDTPLQLLLATRSTRRKLLERRALRAAAAGERDSG